MFVNTSHKKVGYRRFTPWFSTLIALFLLSLLLSACGDHGGSVETVAALDPPSTVAVTAETDTAVIQWSSVPGVDSYNVYWSTSPGVTKTTGNLLPDESSPCLHSGLTPGTTYYYVVTAVYPAGESTESAEMSVQITEVEVGMPENVAALVTEEEPNSITIQWDPVEGANSYNIYWATTPGVTKDSGTLIADVTSPYIHTGLVGGTAYYYVVTAVAGGDESAESSEVSATPRGSRRPGQGGHESSYGNNLSFPLIFADGYGITGELITGVLPPETDLATGLRPSATETPPTFPYWDPDSAYVLNNITYYQQQTASTWQAEWRNGSAEEQHVVADWGDILTSKTRFTPNSMIRVETVLYQDTSATDPADTMVAYNMMLLYGSHRTEMQGTDSTTYESNIRNVFATNARLKIEKLDGPGGNVVAEHLNEAVYESFGNEGPGGFAAEINVSGKCVYGYVWMLSQTDIPAAEKLGWWRITFSLDPASDIGGISVPNNVSIDELDSSETKAVLVSPVETSIEIEVTSQTAGGGGGGAP